MGDEWVETTWGELAVLGYGKGLRGYRDSTGEYPVYGTNGPIGWTDEPLCSHETVVVGRKGAYRGIHYSKSPCFVIDTAFYLSPKSDFNMTWAYYQLLTQNINGMDSGSAIPSTSRDSFYLLPVRQPPRKVQDRIANILGTLDDKIELNRRMNETLETIARRLFKSWFIDFDPVRAKAALREKHSKWTNERLSREALPKLDPKIAELFPDELVDSELGEIPKGWGVGAIGDVITLDKTSVKPLSHPEELFDHYSIPSHDDGKCPVTEPGSEIKSNKFVVTNDCVLLTKLNPRIRRVWLPFPATSRRSLCSTEFLVLKPKAGIQREFTYSLVSSNSFFETYATMVTGTSGSHQRIRPDHLLAMDSVIPSSEIATAFSNHVDSLLVMQNDLRTESGYLSATRDKLLPKLLSGELATR